MGNIGPQRQRYEVLPDRVDTAGLDVARPATDRPGAGESEAARPAAEPAGREARD